MGFLTQKVEHQHAKLKVSGSTATKQCLKPLNWFGWVRRLLLGLESLKLGQVQHILVSYTTGQLSNFSPTPSKVEVGPLELQLQIHEQLN